MSYSTYILPEHLEKTISHTAIIKIPLHPDLILCFVPCEEPLVVFVNHRKPFHVSLNFLRELLGHISSIFFSDKVAFYSFKECFERIRVVNVPERQFLILLFFICLDLSEFQGSFEEHRLFLLRNLPLFLSTTGLPLSRKDMKDFLEDEKIDFPIILNKKKHDISFEFTS